jgi:hypothetical protein
MGAPRAGRSSWGDGRTTWPKRLQIPIDTAMWRRIATLAKREQCSIAVVARRLVRDGLAAATQRAA